MALPPPSPAAAEPRPTGQGSRGGVMMLCAVVLLIVAAGLIGDRDPSSGTSGPPQAQQAPQAPLSAAPASPAGRPAGRHLPRSKPVRLLIPKISVDAPFTDLAIGPTGQLEAPPADDVNLVGWHAKGVSPGEAGTAIIAGHVDTATSAAVFAGLGELKKGDTFDVVRADRRKATFVVDSVETFDKDDFPSRRVYDDTPQAQVRLITCAGDYDRTVKDYTDNLVVFAHLT
ncbi:sortase [Streptomyces sp. MMG1533]|uniref:class F sortase n=1 Tax=Streptomyces sp. MMG1533 TaxID=1415546 RepID=UPI0006AEB138|nr:class F sortase [Streptomyces sp. MMG1533]KOU56436.1 sortase [Streptomyces sp. MMG1533]